MVHVGDTESRERPTRISALDGVPVVHVSAGDNHSIALAGEGSSDRQLYSWGWGANGRLGHPDQLPRLKPTRINFFRGCQVIAISAGGAHNLAITNNSKRNIVWSWGWNAYGQLGHGDTWDQPVPRPIDELRHVVVRHIAAGERHSLAVCDTRQIWVWGQGMGKSSQKYPLYQNTSAVLIPVQLSLEGIEIISAAAGRSRSYVWGDRVASKMVQEADKSSPTSICSALPQYQSLSSGNLRIGFQCAPCSLDSICIACAHSCHVHHRLELYWSSKDALHLNCSCHESGLCTLADHYDSDCSSKSVDES